MPGSGTLGKLFFKKTFKGFGSQKLLLLKGEQAR